MNREAKEILVSSVYKLRRRRRPNPVGGQFNAVHLLKGSP